MAHARLIQATIPPDKVEEAIVLCRASIRPITQDQPSFKGTCPNPNEHKHEGNQNVPE